ncbi:MAG TPA: hypothetical protein VNK04_18840 [Gemmataceae bacterium]|nr:hypothetical protein [Gemmataceae bacterium]
MSARDKGNIPGPDPQELAAYVDGELAPEACGRIEAWLAEHPEAAAEVEALRCLARLWQAAPPPEPSEAAWSRTAARIEAALTAAARARPGRRLRRAWGLAALAAAAAVVLAVILSRPAGVAPPPAPEVVEPLPVATADDIEIISMDPADARALVVGEPPVSGPLALLGPGEAAVDQVKSDMEGMAPYYSRDDSATPMVVMMPREE